MSTDPIVTSVDLITFEILSHRVYQIAKEMGTTLERVGGTVNTTQMHDYMAALYLANGDVLCAGDAMGWDSPGSPGILNRRGRAHRLDLHRDRVLGRGGVSVKPMAQARTADVRVGETHARCDPSGVRDRIRGLGARLDLCLVSLASTVARRRHHAARVLA